MHKLTRFFIALGILTSLFMVVPTPAVSAQVSLPAAINKQFTPISIQAGGTSRLSVSIFNPNSFQLNNASWIDNLVGVQSGLVIANPPNVTSTCGGTVTANPGGTTLSLSGGTVPAKVGVAPGSCTVSIDVTSTTVGNLINTIPAGALTATDGGGVTITNAESASATLRVESAGTPTVSKSFSPNTVWVGQTSQLSIVIRNTDLTVTLTQASITDSLPSGVSLANPVSPTLTGCGASASLSAVSGGTTVTLTNATIAPNSTCTIRVNVISNTQGAYNNTIPANALQTQQGRTNTSPASARLTVQAIGITKAFSPPNIPAGGTTTLTITLQNPTSSPYTGVNVSDTLPGTVLTVVPGTATTTCGGTVSTTLPRTVSLTGGTIPAGTITTPGTCTISVQVTAPLGSSTATYRNTIPVGALTTNQGVSNNRAASGNVTVGGTDVTGTKSFSPATIGPGGNSRLRIDIFGPSDTNLNNFTLTDNLPAGVTVSNSTAPTITGCGAIPPLVFTAPTGATSISLTNGLILAGQRCRIDVYVTSSVSGVYTNTISPAQITNNENRVPASSLTANLTVTNLANVSIGVVKGFDPLTVFGGSASTMSLQLSNTSTTPLNGITLTDTMPPGMIIANPPNFSTGTCGGTLTGNPGTSTISFSGGSLPANGTCTLTLSVTMTVNGNRTNIIPAGAVTATGGASNPQPAEASLTNLPGASISKVFAPNPIAAGDFSILTITIQNTGNIALTGLGLSDALPGTLPAGLTIAGANAPAPVNNCGGTLTATPGTQNIQLSGGSLGASSSCTIVISVTGSTPGDYQNCIDPGSLTNDQGAVNGQAACDTLGVLNGQGGLTKSVNPPRVTIGEIFTYQVSMVIPPGIYPSTKLLDTMDHGLAFVGCDSINAAGLTTDVVGGFSAVCANPTTDDAGGGTPEDVDRRVTYNFGTLTNSGSADVTVTVNYRAIVLDIGANLDGVTRNNSAVWMWATGSAGPVRTTIEILEPKLIVDKTADNSFIANGTEATITLTVSHTSASHLDAHDVVLTDPLPIGLDYVPNSLDCTAGAQDPDVECIVDTTTDPSRPTIRAGWTLFTLAGGTSLIRFRVAGNSSLPPGGNVTNVADLTWTSLPGDHSTPESFSNPPNQFAIERHFDAGSAVDIYGDEDIFVFNPLGGPGGGEDEDERGRVVPRTGFLIPVTGFAPNTVTKLESTRPLYETTGLSLEIPAVQVNVPIVGVQLQNGAWDVNWLWNQAGWLQKTAYPTFPGNSVITAHVVNADGQPGPFARIKQLRVGDYIFIYLGGYRYTYEVVTNAPVKPNDISVLRHEENSWLTLITCDKYDVKTGKYLVRVAVHAKLIDIDYK